MHQIVGQYSRSTTLWSIETPHRVSTCLDTGLQRRDLPHQRGVQRGFTLHHYCKPNRMHATHTELNAPHAVILLLAPLSHIGRCGLVG